MGVITTSTFDPMKARMNVRLQQGVPIVDADWNELDDIRKFEMRTYLKWFVGDGVPEGSDAFRIDALAAPATDDFIVRAGVGSAPAGTSGYEQALRFAGRAIVDGLDVMISADVNYKAQPLFAASAFGIPQIAPVVSAVGPVAVYLDVWERLVTSQEDPSLVLSGIGTESCARIKREWCVRTRTGSTSPQPGAADYLPGHSYCLLAVINLSGAAPLLISPGAIQDLRHRRVSLAALESRVVMLERYLLLPTFNPSPNQFAPKTGSAGQQVTLNGRNFNLGTVSVKFGATAAALVGAATPTQIVATVPNLAAGNVNITVNTDGGTAVSTDLFNVLPPVAAPAFAASPNQFAPKTGSMGQLVTLFGVNFGGATSVTINDIGVNPPCQIVGPVTAAQIPIKLPAVGLTPGSHTFTVVTPGGTVASTDTFTLVP